MTTTESTQRRPFPDAAVHQPGAGWADPPPPARQPTLTRWLPLVAWLGTLAVAIALLVALGGGRLAAPDLLAPGSWATWAAGRDPLEVSMVVVRLLGLALAWYLVGVTSISVLSRLLRAARLVRLADALAVGPVRVIAQQAVGVSLAAGVLVTAVPPTAWTDTTPPAATETIAPLQTTATPTPALLRDPSPADAPPRSAMTAPVPAPSVSASAPTDAEQRAAPSPEPGTSASPAPDPPAGPAPSPTAGPTPPTSPVSDERTVTVASGDHFWALASDDLAQHLRRAPSDVEVVEHWRSVVDANRDRLVVADNPDLLVPGQQVVLPPVPGASP